MLKQADKSDWFYKEIHAAKAIREKIKSEYIPCDSTVTIQCYVTTGDDMCVNGIHLIYYWPLSSVFICWFLFVGF